MSSKTRTTVKVSLSQRSSDSLSRCSSSSSTDEEIVPGRAGSILIGVATRNTDALLTPRQQLKITRKEFKNEQRLSKTIAKKERKLSKITVKAGGSPTLKQQSRIAREQDKVEQRIIKVEAKNERQLSNVIRHEERIALKAEARAWARDTKANIERRGLEARLS